MLSPVPKCEGPAAVGVSQSSKSRLLEMPRVGAAGFAGRCGMGIGAADIAGTVSAGVRSHMLAGRDGAGGS
jgi:hypothetical protein